MPQPPIYLTTTGTLSPVPITDIGKVPGYAHPTTNFNILEEFNLPELAGSADLQAAVDNGYIILKDQYDNPITNVFPQLVTSLEIRDGGVTVADYVASLDFYGALISTGPQGFKAEIAGFQGPTGTQGALGFTGNQGPVGIGVQGPVGGIGPQGIIGPTGEDSTVAGPQGIVGPQGYQGIFGNTGSDSDVPGPQGVQGLQGVTGAPQSGDSVDSFNLSGAFNGTTNKSIYLNGIDGVSMGIVSYIAPFDCTLEAMSGASDGTASGTWQWEVHVNGTLVTGAILSHSGDASWSSSYGTVAQFSAGDKIQLYLNEVASGSMAKPRANAIFRRVAT